MVLRSGISCGASFFWSSSLLAEKGIGVLSKNFISNLSTTISEVQQCCRIEPGCLLMISELLGDML